MGIIRTLKNLEVVILIFALLVNVFLFVYLIRPQITSNIVLVKNYEKKAPYDFIKENEIFYKNGQLILNITHPVLSRYNSSGSMMPVLSENSTGIGIRPLSEKEVHIGDIVSFWKNGGLITHRVVDKGYDDKGVYFITEGDNSDFADKFKVRFSEIDSVLVAIIY